MFRESNHIDRAQVGIGTLVVFIAMVLVAAIGAGVQVERAGFLQSQSEETGEQASQQVTNRVNVVSDIGRVSGGNSEIIVTFLILKKAPGAGDINLSEATVQWISPAGSTFLTTDDTELDVTTVTGSRQALTPESDVFNLDLILDEPPINRESTPGESAGGWSTTFSGGTTRVSIQVPEFLADNDPVSL